MGNLKFALPFMGLAIPDSNDEENGKRSRQGRQRVRGIQAGEESIHDVEHRDEAESDTVKERGPAAEVRPAAIRSGLPWAKVFFAGWILFGVFTKSL